MGEYNLQNRSYGSNGISIFFSRFDNRIANRIKRFEIAYVAESYGGDRLSFWQEQTGDNEYCIRITKLSEDEEKTIEVCRCKVVFVKN